MSLNFDLLDASVEELAELESFEPFPAGTYRVSLRWEKKEINDKPAVELKFLNKEVIELSDINAEPVAEEREGSVTFYLYKNDGSINSVGQGQLRKVVETLRESFGGDTTSEIMDNSEGAEVIATFKVKTNDKGSQNVIQSLAVA